VRLRLPLPAECAVCRGWGRTRLCAACLGRYTNRAPRCLRCAIELPAGPLTCGRCLHDPPPYARCVAAFDYAAPWDHPIARFKFHAALDLGGVFADRLVDAVRASAAPLPDLILPVPLAEARLRERGYNQAWELARRLGRRLRVSGDATLLLRLRETPHQLALPIEARAGNVRGAFAVEPRRRAELAGRHVALVDDVMTTGATVAEAARVLLAAGAAPVQVWVLARTPRPA
jgi:ComF family protein